MLKAAAISALLHGAVVAVGLLWFTPDPVLDVARPQSPPTPVTVKLRRGSAPEEKPPVRAEAAKSEAIQVPSANENHAAPRSHERGEQAEPERTPAPDAQSTPSRKCEEGADGALESLAKTPKGRYPSRASRNRWEGTVVLRFRIAADGSCADVRVVGSSGHRLLDDDAAAVIREKWKFPEGDAGREIEFSYIYCLRCSDDRRCAKHAR